MSGPWSNQVVSQVIVGQAGSPQVVISEEGGIGQITFPFTIPALSNTANITGEEVGGDQAELIIAGPGLAAAGHKQWVSIQLTSSDGASSDAGIFFNYIDTTGTGHTICGITGGGFFFEGAASFLPVGAPTGYPLAGGATAAQIVTTLNSLIANLIAGGIVS